MSHPPLSLSTGRLLFLYEKCQTRYQPARLTERDSHVFCCLWYLQVINTLRLQDLLHKQQNHAAFVIQCSWSLHLLRKSLLKLASELQALHCAIEVDTFTFIFVLSSLFWSGSWTWCWGVAVTFFLVHTPRLVLGGDRRSDSPVLCCDIAPAPPLVSPRLQRLA